MKVACATEGQLGLPAFPPRPERAIDREDISRDEWGNVATARVATANAVATIASAGRHMSRWLLMVAVWIALFTQAVCAVGVTLRPVRVRPGRGLGPHGWSTWFVLAILDLGAIARAALPVVSSTNQRNAMWVRLLPVCEIVFALSNATSGPRPRLSIIPPFPLPMRWHPRRRSDPIVAATCHYGPPEISARRERWHPMCTDRINKRANCPLRDYRFRQHAGGHRVTG